MEVVQLMLFFLSKKRGRENCPQNFLHMHTKHWPPAAIFTLGSLLLFVFNGARICFCEGKWNMLLKCNFILCKNKLKIELKRKGKSMHTDGRCWQKWNISKTENLRRWEKSFVNSPWKVVKALTHFLCTDPRHSWTLSNNFCVDFFSFEFRFFAIIRIRFPLAIPFLLPHSNLHNSS